MKKEILYKGEKIILEKFSNNEEGISFELNGRPFSFKKGRVEGSLRTLFNGDEKVSGHVCHNNVIFNGIDLAIEKVKRGKKKSSDGDGGGMTSPMPGKILKINVSQGQEVKKGDSLLVMEAMKMEHTIKADKDGLVKTLFFGEGDQVDGGVDLVEIEVKE